MWDFKLFSEITFYQGAFAESELYFLDYQGDYKYIGGSIFRTGEILTKFKTDNSYFVFCIYYDDPSKVADVTKSRAVHGIARNLSTKSSFNREIKDFLINNGYKRIVMPQSKSVMSTFKYIYPISILIAVKKYYSAMTHNLTKEEFRNKFNTLQDFPCSVEVYTDKTVTFYKPSENIDKFLISSLPQPEFI